MGNVFALLGVLILVWLLAALAVRAIGGNVLLLDDWRQAWRWYSTWALLGVGMLPDLWNAAVASGYVSFDEVPGPFGAALKLAVVAVFVVSKVKQAGKGPAVPDFSRKDGE